MYIYKVFKRGEKVLELNDVDFLKRNFKTILHNGTGIYPLVRSVKHPMCNSLYMYKGYMCSEKMIGKKTITVDGLELTFTILCDLGDVTQEEAYNIMNSIDNKSPWYTLNNIYSHLNLTLDKYTLYILMAAKAELPIMTFSDQLYFLTVKNESLPDDVANDMLDIIVDDAKTAAKFIKDKEIAYDGFGKPIPTAKSFTFLSNLNLKKFRRMVKNKKA